MAAISSLKISTSIPRSFPASLTVPSPPISIRTDEHFHLPSSLPPRNRLNHTAPLLLSRRQFLPSVSGIFDALTGGNNARDAVVSIRRGMLLFRQGDVSGSLAEFDKAIELDPRQKESHFKFEEGAEQFRLDVAQNPNDTEESIWCFLCEAQLYGVDEARRRFLEVGRDPRPIMREAYNMFKDGGDPEKYSFGLILNLIAMTWYARWTVSDMLVAAFLNGRENEYFYASVYAGLYHESEKNPDSAKQYILAAGQSPYGQRSDDYMAALAKVHFLCRNWRSN